MTSLRARVLAFKIINTIGGCHWTTAVLNPGVSTPAEMV
jgi:hypothetical protein